MSQAAPEDAVHVQDGHVFWHCPGCKCAHRVPFNGEGRPMWTFNGDKVRPTLSPSVLVTWDDWAGVAEPGPPNKKVCHCYVQEGKIQFLGDCTHELAGQTVPCTPP